MMVIKGKRKNLTGEDQQESINIGEYARKRAKARFPSPVYIVSWYDEENEAWLSLEYIDGDLLFRPLGKEKPVFPTVNVRVIQSANNARGFEYDYIDASLGLVCDDEVHYVLTGSYNGWKTYIHEAHYLENMPHIFLELYQIKFSVDTAKAAYRRYRRMVGG